MSSPWNLDRTGWKVARTGTHRAATLEETWRRLGPASSACGVTRVADVTGLDLIGIPVATAYRPNARSLSVSQGKGVSRAASRVSAAMEAVEHAHAEVIDHPLRLARPAELGPAALDPRGLPRRRRARRRHPPTVAHLDAAQGYRPVNEAMVTIRATLRAAVAEGVIPGGEAADLVAAAKELHYPDRRWPDLLAGRDTPLRDWLPGGRRDVKRADALALLGLLAADGIRPADRTWHFERTSQWRAVRPVGRTALPPAVAAAVLDTLRVRGEYAARVASKEKQ